MTNQKRCNFFGKRISMRKLEDRLSLMRSPSTRHLYPTEEDLSKVEACKLIPISDKVYSSPAFFELFMYMTKQQAGLKRALKAEITLYSAKMAWSKELTQGVLKYSLSRDYDLISFICSQLKTNAPKEFVDTIYDKLFDNDQIKIINRIGCNIKHLESFSGWIDFSNSSLLKAQFQELVSWWEDDLPDHYNTSHLIDTIKYDTELNF